MLYMHSNIHLTNEAGEGGREKGGRREGLGREWGGRREGVGREWGVGRKRGGSDGWGKRTGKLDRNEWGGREMSERVGMQGNE